MAVTEAALQEYAAQEVTYPGSAQGVINGVGAHEPIGVRIARLKSEISDRDVQIALLKAQKVELRNQLAKLSGRD